MSTLLDKLVPLEDVAARMRRDPDALYAQWRRSKGSPSMHRVSAGHYLVNAEEVDRWLASRAVSGPDRDAAIALCRPARLPIVAPPQPQRSRRARGTSE